MKLGFFGFETAIEFGEENFYSLVFEDANYFYEIVSMINRQADDGVGEFVLSQNNKEMKFESAVAVISSVLDLGLNTKKVQGLVLKKLAALAQDDVVTIAVQICGKMRGTIEMPKDAPQSDVEAAALALDNVKRQIDGKNIKKVIVVPNKIVNIVAA